MFDLNKFYLRPINITDKEQVFRWRNQEEVRKYMYTDHPISKEEHDLWFNIMLDDNDMYYLVFESNYKPAGLVCFTNIDQRNEKSDWGFYLGEADIPKGSGFVMEFLALEFAFETLSLRKLCCEIFSFNTSVTKMHKRFGFVEEGVYKSHILKQGKFEDVTLMALFREHWLKNRVMIINKYFS
ncbi:pseudaminic acid biosynthesis N-acetyl transferase [[Leptolyngbya] sp. PCC 7376]|uniref:UDP-4-amino-4, 6-dideoxy-N-acetyl-beta-L-altrosamine N-acetyltransferase n=1 Tax=[Leptolyngbya] sp. PCC 7376 TaxID=111781 RepID=UPI00029F205A|nr:UDP-4-amino-4,6-dideoxy-N-acetyl-beta-L-altrosamine N-acetyltransferase [[Leptolyngbya] sp. PCC 7376]AFY36530.1 pseudaminic acid biosynthesis N-acetyl transferase [[Leptolyngbya] sp. PCC 7376]